MYLPEPAALALHPASLPPLPLPAAGVDLRELEFVMVMGHFLARDENIFTIFEGGPQAQAATQQQQLGEGGAGCLPLMQHREPYVNTVAAAAAVAAFNGHAAAAAAAAAGAAALASSGGGSSRGSPGPPTALQQHQQPARNRWVPTPPLTIFESQGSGLIEELAAGAAGKSAAARPPARSITCTLPMLVCTGPAQQVQAASQGDRCMLCVLCWSTCFLPS
jgi:hypothetical protein